MAMAVIELYLNPPNQQKQTPLWKEGGLLVIAS